MTEPPTRHPPPPIDATRFSTARLPAREQALAWRERVGHVIDMPPSNALLENGFAGRIDRYSVDGLTFTDAQTDAHVLERSVARVSTDARRDFAFHLYLEGTLGAVTGMQRKRSEADATERGIIAIDLGQPFRIERTMCRVLTIFVPRAIVDHAIPDGGESIHGRILPHRTAHTALIFDHIAAIAREIPTLDAHRGADMLVVAQQLLIDAFRAESRLRGKGRAAVQAAVMGRVRRYIDANLHQANLTPASVVDALQLKRATIYRWFEHEGGLGAYIRHRRLREAADELVRFPHLQVTEIAYGLGFSSASDFTRAFRRAFDMSPLDLRIRALALQNGQQNSLA
ncbi:AraC family transcriptional regulator [Paraburkholderia sp.]|uniref:AraC family transcriptional regulator n=1 Tax=Paraburkholderia sp. TaxID=1926495 RepID=UPI00239B3C31|nr:AraC family transcriptional regulator [Paraburkholderia sp.]MDE1182436.1 AraC family transcriptional regulator [Paraburkholderia sp.]